MTKPLPKEAGRISADTLAAAAAQGVQRALAARMTELSPEQTEQVSGAALAAPTTISSVKLRPPIIYGLWYPIDPVSVKTLDTQQF